MFTAGRRATSPSSRRTLAAAAAAVSIALVGAAGCASDESDIDGVPLDVPETVALGDFPEPLSDDLAAPPPPTVAIDVTTTTTEAPREPITGPLGEEVFGNRVLVIGDTQFQSTSPRAGGELCDALLAFGWQGEIAAEVGRFVEFGQEVVDARVIPEEPEWDAAVVMLGNHFDGDIAGYRAELNELVKALAPRPMLVFTLVEDDTYQADLNLIIRELPQFHPNVVVVDWADIAAGEPDVILADTPSGLSEEGSRKLSLFTVAALGEPPVTDGAGCLPPVFTDDSAIVL